MKVLFDHPFPFALAHGGFQIQIEQTILAVERRGVEVEHVRWWDDRQTGDVIHYFGRPSGSYIDFAHAKGLKVVVAELLTGLGSRSAPARWLQKALMRGSQILLPRAFTAKLSWEAYQKADGFIANTDWEAYLMRTMFNASPEKIRVIPNGVEELFLAPVEPVPVRSDYLVCTAAIHPRKRVVELAEAAALARVPVWIIGKPYAESDPYYRRFLEVQQCHPEWVRYEGGVSDRAALARIYHLARGFVLLSTMETLSLSSFEAATAGCPLLLSDLPWAHSAFGSQATYASVSLPTEKLALVLADFHARTPSLTSDFKPLTWDAVADRMKDLYQSLR